MSEIPRSPTFRDVRPSPVKNRDGACGTGIVGRCRLIEFAREQTFGLVFLRFWIPPCGILHGRLYQLDLTVQSRRGVLDQLVHFGRVRPMKRLQNAHVFPSLEIPAVARGAPSSTIPSGVVCRHPNLPWRMVSGRLSSNPRPKSPPAATKQARAPRSLNQGQAASANRLGSR